MFDPAMHGYQLSSEVDKPLLERVMQLFAERIKRARDTKLIAELRDQVLNAAPPALKRRTFFRLAKWCKTGGIYADAMPLAKQISELLFGRVIDRSDLGI